MTGHVFLTGGTGFLGRELLEQLGERGSDVHALARAGREVVEAQGLQWHRGDLTDPASVGRVLRQARNEVGEEPFDVIHGGALISYRTRDREEQWRVNVEGTRSVLEAARETGVRRFLHISSVVTVGHASGEELLDERSSYNGAELRVDYVDTKRAAEELVLAAGESMEVVVVNPGAIFGPATPRSNSAHFLEKMAAGAVRFAPPGGVGVVGVEDVARGCLLALERGRSGERYLLVESNLSFLELIRQVAEVCGVREARGVVPRWLWGGVERGARLLDRVKGLERLTPQAMRMVSARSRFDARKAKEELGWRPAGFAEVVRGALEGMGLVAGDGTD